MNEQQTEEHYVLQEQREIAQLVSASYQVGCVLIVGGFAADGARHCGHLLAEHVGSRETGDLLCLGCERDHVPLSCYQGKRQLWPGRDHQFTKPLHHMPQVAAGASEERAAA